MADCIQKNSSTRIKIPEFTHYCLGNGATKCDGCDKEKNWGYLNTLPDLRRLEYQKTLIRIDDTECILSGRPWKA